MFGIFKWHAVEMSPQVRGRITNAGKPVAGIQVARSLVYEGYQNGKEQLEHAITNEDGEFSFQPMLVKSRKPGDIFGQNIPVMQAIYVEHNDKLYRLWNISKTWDPIKPLSDLLLQLNGDLQNKEIHHELDTQDFGGRPNHVIISICYWKHEKLSSYYNHKLITSYGDIHSVK